MQVSYISDYESFYQYAKAQPILTPEEEYEYASLVQSSNDAMAAQKLIVSHLKLVLSIARNYFSFGLDKDDLVQEGTIGLMKSVKKFDPTKGVRLSVFATYFIKSEINKYLIHNWRIVRSATTKAQNKLFFNFNRVKSLIGSGQSLSDKNIDLIAEELNVPVSEVKTMQSRLLCNDCDIDDFKEDSFQLSEILTNSDHDTDNVLGRQSQELLLVEIKEQLKTLDFRTYDIIMARWVNDEPVTLRELSEKHGVSMERIRQIEVAGLKKLKSLVKLPYFSSID